MSSPLDFPAGAYGSIPSPLGDDATGFYLLDDADGRFVIDREIGVVSLADEALVESERGAIHAVKLRVIEPSGDAYELELRLRVTGRVPQMVGAEDFATPAATAPAEPAPPTVGSAHAVAWTRYTPALAVSEKNRREHGRRAFIATEFPRALETLDHASLEFGGELGVFSASAPWSL